MTARLDALDRIHAACWHELTNAAHARSHAWRRMALATVGGAEAGHDGQPVAEVRSVVLREVQAEARILAFYTDSRASKVAQLRAQPVARLLCWCPTLGWQLRLRARMAVDTGGLGVSSRWARMKMHPAAQDYLSPLPPGSVLDTPADQAPAAPDRGSREHFAVVFATVEHIDWLELHADGHRRAGFTADGRGQWLTP